MTELKKISTTPEDILLDILLQVRATLKDELTLEADPYKLHKFFFEQRKLKASPYLNVFYFNDDPDFPYSPDLELALLRLQDYGYLVRPNPALREFKIKLSEKEKPKKIIDNSKLIEEFKKRFVNR